MKASEVSGVDALLALAAQWEAEAETLARYKDERGAATCTLHAAELRAAVSAVGEELLTLADAAEVSGYSVDHLRHRVADGSIPNKGRKGSPLIRRSDLPVKASAALRCDDGAAGEILREIRGQGDAA